MNIGSGNGLDCVVIWPSGISTIFQQLKTVPCKAALPVAKAVGRDFEKVH